MNDERCVCGHVDIDHENGTFKCRACPDETVPCPMFVLDRAAVAGVAAESRWIRGPAAYRSLPARDGNRESVPRGGEPVDFRAALAHARVHGLSG
jgi:hypothetical protein